MFWASQICLTKDLFLVLWHSFDNILETDTNSILPYYPEGNKVIYFELVKEIEIIPTSMTKYDKMSPTTDLTGESSSN